MESDPKLKPRLELEQGEPSKKRKGFLKKIKEFIIHGLQRRISGEWKDWGDW